MKNSPTIKKYQPQTAAEAFTEILKGEAPQLVVGNFLDDWRRTSMAEREALVITPITSPRNAEETRWAAFFAAMIDQLCKNDEVIFPDPTWINDPRFVLSEPWFMTKGSSLRAWQLFTTPVAFKMRNIFGGDNLLSRA
jgi:hypothetical protein